MYLKFQIILTVHKLREIQDSDDPQRTGGPKEARTNYENEATKYLVSYPSKLISLFGEKLKKCSPSQKNEYIPPKALQRLDKIPDFQITLDFLPFLASFFLCWCSLYSNRLGYYYCCKKMRINFNFTKKRRKNPKKDFSMKMTYLLLLLLLFELMTVTTFITVLIVTAAKAKN